MTDLAEFLLARLVEDEAAARIYEGKVIAQRLRDLAERVADIYGDPDPPEGDIGVVDALWFAVQDAAEWVARHDPARVLAEVAAKRRIVERLMYRVNDGINYDTATRFWFEEVLLALAQPYADHESFREEWRV